MTVPAGEKGLRQSEALFQHVKALPDLLDRLLAGNPEAEIAAVCASVSPRPQADSYMPVFRAGESFGRGIATALRVRFDRTTHQEGHLRAAIVGTPLSLSDSHIAVHLSGGTTEVLWVRDGSVTVLGGTKDLHAGQLIDRIGVRMGLPFPAGPSLEALAQRGMPKALLPVSVDGRDCHFSGAEAQALRLLDSGALPEEVAAEVFSLIARTVSRMVLAGCEAASVNDALLFGGVASSAWIGQAVRERLARRNAAIRLHIAKRELSGDNAVGVALLGAEMTTKRRNEDGKPA